MIQWLACTVHMEVITDTSNLLRLCLDQTGVMQRLCAVMPSHLGHDRTVGLQTDVRRDLLGIGEPNSGLVCS